MNDLLNVPILVGDYIYISDRIYKVTKSYANSIKFTNGTGEISTSMREKVLKLNDFNPTLIDTILTNTTRIAALDEFTSRVVLVTQETRLSMNAESRRRNELKKTIKKWSIVKIRSGASYVYIGRKAHPNNPAAELYHWYIFVGYWYGDTPDSIIQRFTNSPYVHDYYSSVSLDYMKSMKQPDLVSNNYTDFLQNYFENLPTISETDTRYRNYTLISALI